MASSSGPFSLVPEDAFSVCLPDRLASPALAGAGRLGVPGLPGFDESSLGVGLGPRSFYLLRTLQKASLGLEFLACFQRMC
jgi:hypothetical protein